jgi:hypothetical protein
MSEKKPEPLQDDPAESKRFIDMARELEADQNEGAMDKAFKKVIPSKPHIAQDALIGRKPDSND